MGEAMSSCSCTLPTHSIGAKGCMYEQSAPSYVAVVLPHQDRLLIDGRYHSIDTVRAALAARTTPTAAAISSDAIAVSEPVASEDDRQQVVAQYRVIASLAQTIAHVHSQLADTYAAAGPDSMLNTLGERSARLMDDLGDVVDGMDAATEEDSWMDAIFERAHARWPTHPTGAGADADVLERYLALAIEHMKTTDESEEERLADLMDPLWNAMTERQRNLFHEYNIAYYNAIASSPQQRAGDGG